MVQTVGCEYISRSSGVARAHHSKGPTITGGGTVGCELNGGDKLRRERTREGEVLVLADRSHAHGH